MAKTPIDYAHFITGLTLRISEAIKNNYGVFDKFTGDGVLAFFPSFYSGEDALLLSLKTAQECHEIFNDHYRLSRACFHTIRKDIGLGIGIDFGWGNLVSVNSELTVVGTPVVYACRLSSAPTGITLLNQAAYEAIQKKYSPHLSAEETEIDSKHEGTILAYKVSINFKALQIKEPDWDVEIKKYKDLKVFIENKA